MQTWTIEKSSLTKDKKSNTVLNKMEGRFEAGLSAKPDLISANIPSPIIGLRMAATVVLSQLMKESCRVRVLGR